MLAENLQHWAEKERMTGEQIGLQKGQEEARGKVQAVRKATREETKLEMVLGMIALDNVSDEQIAKLSGFSLEEIATLRKSSGH